VLSAPDTQLIQPQSLASENQNGSSGGTYTGALVPGHTITANSLVVSTPELPITTIYKFSRMDSAHTLLQEGSSPSYTLTSEDLDYEIKITMVSTAWRSDEAITVGSDTVSIYTGYVQVAPTNDTAPSIAGATAQGAPLAAAHGEWHGGGGGSTLTYTYQWERCDSSGASCTSIIGAASQVYTSTSSDIGHTLRVAVTAENQGASGSATSTHTVTITAAAAITNTTAPTITGETTELKTLTAQSGEWSGSAPIAYTYQWEICDTEGSECFEIPGATEATYTLAAGAVGATIRVSVTATNAAGASTTSSAATAVVEAAPAPVNLSRPSITLLGPAQPGSSATTTGGDWQNISLDPAARALTYQWERCNHEGAECQPIENATEKTYSIAGADGGSRLRVTVTAENPTGRTSSASVLSVAISETSPMTAEKMVYTSATGIYAADIDGTEAQQLTDCATVDPEAGGGGCVFAHPSISSTGAMIAATVRPNSAHGACPENQVCPNDDTTPEDRIALMNYDGGEPRILAGEGSQPTWAPGGTSLTFTRTVESGGTTTTSLYTISTYGSGAEAPTPLPTGTAISESPTFSPEGDQLAYVGKQTAAEPWGLYTANPDGSNASRMTLTGIGSVDDPHYNPDGSKIIFIATAPAPAPHTYPQPGPAVRSLYSVNRDGTGLHRITEDAEEYNSPVPATENEIIVVKASVTVLELSSGGEAIVKNPGHLEVIPIEGGTPEPVHGEPGEVTVRDVTQGPLLTASGTSHNFCKLTPLVGVTPWHETYNSGSASYSEENVAVQLSAHITCDSGYAVAGGTAKLGAASSTDTWGVPDPVSGTFGAGSYVALPHLTYSCIGGYRWYAASAYTVGGGSGYGGFIYLTTGAPMSCNAAGAWRVRTYKLSEGKEPNKILRHQLGEPPGPDYDAHHIIPVYERRDKEANRLEAYGYACLIYPNASFNGVYVPRTEHRGMHNSKYWNWVANVLGKAIGANMACPDHTFAKAQLGVVKRTIPTGRYPGAPNA
jgi:Tol biopolymer transport system component